MNNQEPEEREWPKTSTMTLILGRDDGLVVWGEVLKQISDLDLLANDDLGTRDTNLFGFVIAKLIREL